MESHPVDENSVIISWDAWLASPPGRYLLEWEQAQYDRTVGDIFGYHALQLGMPKLPCLRENRIPWKGLVLDERPAAESPEDAASTLSLSLCRFDELPLESQSIDLVVLPHVLEFAADPHAVLREVERVLMPEGQVVLTGFNPMSLWGLREGCARLFGAERFVPRDGQFLAHARIKDWLKLLGFDIGRGRFGCYRPAYHSEKWLGRSALLEKAGDRWWPIFGATYMLSGVKRVRGMRLVGPAWKDKASKARAAAPALVPSSHPRSPAGKITQQGN
ncbi:MAG: class I SAM-dependent methyltransferase [Candidatus Protistobacter heckmanni]|nr:class I SAM-dependent methyltransferase [Candidatus Protistobacter heckmanni]